MLTVDDLAEFRRLLLEERKAISVESEATAQGRATVTLDQQSVGRLSRMDALQRQAMAQATARRKHGRQARIDAALHRLDDGEFGFCQDCGEDIGKKRLELDATLALCISCARG